MRELYGRKYVLELQANAGTSGGGGNFRWNLAVQATILAAQTGFLKKLQVDLQLWLAQLKKDMEDKISWARSIEGINLNRSQVALQDELQQALQAAMGNNVDVTATQDATSLSDKSSIASPVQINPKFNSDADLDTEVVSNILGEQPNTDAAVDASAKLVTANAKAESAAVALETVKQEEDSKRETAFNESMQKMKDPSPVLAPKVKIPKIDTSEGLAERAKQVEDATKNNKKGFNKEKFEANMGKVAKGVGAATDIASNFIGEEPKDSSMQAINAGTDAAADAAIATGNPYAVAAGAAVKVGGVVNKATGNGGVDGKTGFDKFAGSTAGFMLGAVNIFDPAAFWTYWGNRLTAKSTDKFEVDLELKAQYNDSYKHAFRNLQDAANGAGSYGGFSSSARQDAQFAIELAKNKLNMLMDIRDKTDDRNAASLWEGNALRNDMSLNGGYQSLRAARNGMKIGSLKFAKKAAGGLRLNVFKGLDLENLNLDNSYDANLIYGSSNVAEAIDNLGEFLLNSGGTKTTDKNGNTVIRIGSNALKKYSPKEINDWYTKHMPGITLDWQLYGKGLNLQGYTPTSLLNENWWETNKTNILANIDTYWTPKLLDPAPGKTPEETSEAARRGNLSSRATSSISDIDTDAPGFSFTLIPGRTGLLAREMAYTTLSTSHTALIAAQFPGVTQATLKSNLPTLQDLISLDADFIARNEFTSEDTLPEYEKNLFKQAGFKWDENKKQWVKSQKLGGILTPLTDLEVQKFKEGGTFNVIPEGALHKNKHHMDGAEGLTKKGIPVVTIEDGKKILQAEIEKEEIIFRLEVTEKLEELKKKAKESESQEEKDKLAIEAGKLLVDEILHNTVDNAGLLKEIK